MSKMLYKLKNKRIFGLLLTIIVVYLLIRIKKYDHREIITLQEVKPIDAWEFVADFSNMKYLNPTIIDFNILSESGNYAHWKYKTQYTENLSHWPYLSNQAIASYDVIASTNPKVINGLNVDKNSAFFINSTHNTCLMMGLVCLDARSQFKFSRAPNDKDALCEEIVQYECPVFLSSFCKREVVYQRTAIMDNLSKHFLYHKQHVNKYN